MPYPSNPIATVRSALSMRSRRIDAALDDPELRLGRTLGAGRTVRLGGTRRPAAPSDRPPVG